jgi:hypothetical protein
MMADQESAMPEAAVLPPPTVAASDDFPTGQRGDTSPELPAG